MWIDGLGLALVSVAEPKKKNNCSNGLQASAHAQILSTGNVSKSLLALRILAYAIVLDWKYIECGIWSMYERNRPFSNFAIKLNVPAIFQPSIYATHIHCVCITIIFCWLEAASGLFLDMWLNCL